MAKVILTALVVNPHSLLLSAAPADNVYVTGGVQLDLSPGNIKDPKALGVIGPSQALPAPPGVFSEGLSGYYAEIIPGTDLTNAKLQYFAPGGAEIGAGAYPAQIINGNLTLQIVYNQ
jgi:hypothetical protein